MKYVLYGILLLSVAVSSMDVVECIIVRVYEFGGRLYFWNRYLICCFIWVIAKFTAQFNVNWKGVPTYVDALSNIYDNGNNCAVRTYTMLFQYLLLHWLKCSCRLSCETSDKKTFNCNSTIESAWVRIWDTSYYKNVIENCGMKWHEQYQDVM